MNSDPLLTSSEILAVAHKRKLGHDDISIFMKVPLAKNSGI